MGLIDSVPTCKELVEEMAMEAEGIIKGRLAAMVVWGGWKALSARG